MTGVEFLAWWGAIVSTLVLAWDIYKWKTTGAKLTITSSVNMESYNIPEYEGKKLVTANISNVGDRATTITTVALVFYKSKFHKILGKSSKVFVLPLPSTVQPLPFVINPGAIWTAIGEQDEEVKEMAAEGILTWQVFHSQNRKPVSVVIKIQ
jgi:hypothetical protein